MKRIELLSPAGDLERLKYAIDYGADAVYVGGKKLSFMKYTLIALLMVIVTDEVI